MEMKPRLDINDIWPTLTWLNNAKKVKRGPTPPNRINTSSIDYIMITSSS